MWDVESSDMESTFAERRSTRLVTENPGSQEPVRSPCRPGVTEDFDDTCVFVIFVFNKQILIYVFIRFTSATTKLRKF